MGLQGYQSAPIFNGNLPGNNSSLNNAINQAGNGDLQNFSEKISQCLCAISVKYCIKSGSLKAGTTGFGGIFPQIIGITPAGETGVTGSITISREIFSGVPTSPDNQALSYLDLAQTIAHESLHQTQENWLRRMWRENPKIDEEAWAFVLNNRENIESCLISKGCALSSRK